MGIPKIKHEKNRAGVDGNFEFERTPPILDPNTNEVYFNVSFKFSPDIKSDDLEALGHDKIFTALAEKLRQDFLKYLKTPQNAK